MSGHDAEEPMEVEEPQDATGNSFSRAPNNSTTPHTSAGEVTRAQASHMSQDPPWNSDRGMDVDQQGQHQYATGNPSNPAQNNYPDLHTSADQTRQHQDASLKFFNAPQNNQTYPDTSAGQVAQGSELPPTSENKDEVRATLSVQWSDDDDKMQKKKSTLQKCLQTLVHRFDVECDVLKVSEEGKAEITIKPAAVFFQVASEFEALLRKPIKGKDRKTVIITSFSMDLPELEIKKQNISSVNHPQSSVSGQQHVKGQFREQSETTPSTRNVPVLTDNASITLPLSSMSEHQHMKGQLGKQSNMTTSTNVPKLTDNDNSRQEVNLPSSSVSEKQNDQEPPVKQNGSSSSAAVSTREDKTGCVLPVVHFWYMNNIFKEDIKRIERRHGVKMNAEVNVRFEGDQKDEGLAEALSEFTDLVQKRLGDFDGSVTPLKSVDTEEFKDALKMIQRPEHKLLVALSSEEMTIYGPRPISTAISKSLNAAQTSSANTYNSAAESQVTSLNIGMSIRDHLVNNGLNMQESHWKLMTTAFSDDVDKIKKKFSVDFMDSGVHHGKVNVRTHYKRSGGNASMESHAIRALLHLCQKIATSPKNITQHQGATGFSGSKKNSRSSSEGASSGPVVNNQSEYSTRKTEDSAGEGATAGDNKDEECPICKDTFKNKKQLKCKHELCEECLEQLKKHMGPVCPICKDVFGVIEGTQPDGKMSVQKSYLSLPGFEGYGTIVISYYFPDGKQTERHPNPGQRYHGTSRTAYLPDNKEGKEVLHLLQKAFNQKLIFTVGTSTTTGIKNQVTWNDIHHKTLTSGGPQSFGYPDPDYLSRVRDELKAKGIE
ncbi:E3 ubiquitin-protein ligase DTX3L-like isoform X2 [Sparus aurata]|uniref:E3 ubiquitin-protein ligase DTX3L-like isoform X2 n=1 Tax=Sparus aurata TaxID=8175 RepID=UPI0011C1A29C|nr:E3 ubiquitin-protein ligase DTX3L-like isoform X2 [Sparus aurata]